MQRTIETFPVEEIKGRPVLEADHGLPCSPAAIGRLLMDCPVVVNGVISADSLPFNDVPPEGMGVTDQHLLEQVTWRHKRSFEVRSPLFPSRWEDGRGMSYAGMSLKGNFFGAPSIITSSTSPDGLIAYGLQESDIIERTLAASKVMRERGISSEYMLGVAEPKLYPWPVLGDNVDGSEMVPLAEYKRRLVQHRWDNLPGEERTAAQLIELTEKFQDMTFYITLRATDSPYRLADLWDLGIRQKVFDEFSAGHDLAGSLALEADKPEDLDYFLLHHWCPRAADNLAKLHPDLAHRFPTNGNVTVNGGLVDLDSVHGEALGLGDEPITYKDRARDIVDIMFGVMKFREDAGYATDETLKSLGANFFDRYFASSISGLDSSESSGYIRGVYAAIPDFIASRSNREDETYALILDSLHGFFETDEIPEVEEDVFTENLRKALAEVEEMPLMHDTMVELLRQTLPTHMQDAVGERIDDLTLAATANSELHLAPLLCDLDNESYPPRPNKAIRQELRGVIRATIANSMAIRMLPEDPSLFGNQVADNFCELMDKWPVPELEPAIERIAQQAFTEAFSKAQDIGRYTVPPRLLEDSYSLPSVGLQPQRFYWMTDGVPLQDIGNQVRASDEYGLRTVPLFGKRPTEAIVALPADGGEIHEIISDRVCGATMTCESRGRRYMVVEYDKRPRYVLVVERGPDDTKRLRLLLHDYEDEPVATGGLPGPDQPLLF